MFMVWKDAWAVDTHLDIVIRDTLLSKNLNPMLDNIAIALGCEVFTATDVPHQEQRQR